MKRIVRWLVYATIPAALDSHTAGRLQHCQVRISGGERYAKVYNIDYNRCIFCGYCVEACPTDAITHGHGFENANYNTASLIIRKEQMLAPMPTDAKPVIVPEAPVEAGH